MQLFREARARLRNTQPSNMTRHWLVVMTRLQIIFLVLLPLCSAQFSISGPTDGNRRAQGLKYSQEKGIEYEDQRASLGAGDFSIQGASDGNSDFKIVGASDGNADFQIHGASDGNANFHIQGATDGNANFQIQGATDSNADFRIQGPTDANARYQAQAAEAGPQSVIQRPYEAEQGRGRALQYRDPSGLSVNWKSYHSAPQHPPQHALQPTHNAFVPHDAVPQQAPAPRHRQAQRQHAPAAQPAQQPQVPPNYRPYENAPPSIKQLLQFQQQIPYLNIIPEQYRYDAINAQPAPAPAPQQEYEPRAQKARHQPNEQNQYRSQYRGKSRGPSRSKRQTHQRQAHQQPQRVAQAPAEPQPHYSTSVPSRIQELLKFQSQIPYVNHIPEQWRYDALAAGQEQKQEITYQIPKQAEPIRRQPHPREKRQAPQQQSQIRQYRQHPQQQQAQQQPARQQPQYQRISQPPPEPQPQYSTNLPSQLQQLLKFQAQIPYVNSIPEKFRYENLLAAQGGQPGHAPSRQKRQAPYQQHQQQRQPSPQAQQPQYQRISQPPPEPQPQYSSSVPASIQKILQFQSQTPYNIIANQISYRLDKPYVPERVQAPQAPQYQQPQAPQYRQPQQPAPYRAQAQPSYPQPQGQPSYAQPPGGYAQAQNNVRPVTENQY
ncbi:mediator of RNA polymerase II transcription subunit 15-like [Venturia canescens]|uniref:mediator of RNA polymerase II transcription subunit 15-like n=1 Tax=Venturia canescens TaxID=32260 RepID=UPI001C9C0755|nr:mediator of RNA polymerase II transcription subunit 15-like [Venturia canescens]